MNNYKRAEFVALKDFDYSTPMGISNFKTNVKKGQILNLRVEGRMARKLLAEGNIDVQIKEGATW